MVRTKISATARALRAVFILTALFNVAPIGQAATTVSEPAAGSSLIPANKVASATTKPVARPENKPLWTDLKPAQQKALAPLADEWGKLDPMRKKKWLEIGDKFASMKPDEQTRVQERMHEWTKLTPEQRRVARESYAHAKKLNPDQKSEQWQQYQQLPEEQKKKLAAETAAKKHVANLPPAQSKNKTVPPIKAPPKPAPEQSATLKAGSQSPASQSAPK